MRILLLSNMYPSVDRPFSGVFISERISALQSLGHQMWAFGVRTMGVGAVAAAGRIRGRPTADPVPASPFAEYPLPVDLRRRVQRRPDTTRLPPTHELTTLVAQEGIDLIHGHGMYCSPAGAVARDVARASGVPYVVSVHGSDVNHIMRRRRAAYGEVFDGAGAVIAVSESLARKVRGVMSHPQKVQVVPNGYDPDVFFVDPDVPRTGDRLLFVGNLEVVKGADRLPELMRALDVVRPGLRLDVVGDGRLGTALRAALPGARFHGQIEPRRVAGLMRSADVLVLPSRAEGWGTVITEGLACGTPTVAFDVGGISEAIGVAEHLVPPEAGVAELARKVVTTLAEHRDPGELSRVVMGQTWREVARGEERAYRRALAGRVV